MTAAEEYERLCALIDRHVDSAFAAAKIKVAAAEAVFAAKSEAITSMRDAWMASTAKLFAKE